MTLLEKEIPFGRTNSVDEKIDESNDPYSFWARVMRSIDSRGLVGTLSLVPKNALWALYRWRDARFDRRYGVDTSGLIGLQSLNVIGGNRDDCHYYAPAPAKTIQRIHAALPVDPSQYTFVDVGAGKGRCVLLASMAGFRRVIGVEFSPELADTAKRNAVNFRAKVPTSVEIEVVCEDAGAWTIPAEDCVLFLFNPFTHAVMRRFLDRVEESYQQHGQHILLAYYHPTSADILDGAAFLTSKSYIALPFDPTPENTFEVGTAGHGEDVPYDLVLYETTPRRT